MGYYRRYGAILAAVWITVTCHQPVTRYNQATSCGDLVLEFGHLEDLAESSGLNTYRAVCNPGYKLSGNAIFNCAAENNTLPECHDFDECAEKPASDYWFKPCDTYARCVNTQGSYRCLCRRNWLGDGFRCRQRRFCAPLHAPPNGRVISPRGKTQARYECNPGYRLFGVRQRKCIRGLWRDKTPFCDLRHDICPDPGHINNGRRFPVNRTIFEPKSSVSFVCDDGYELKGTRIRNCSSSYKWTAVQPTCTKMKTVNDLAMHLKEDVNKISRYTITSDLGRLAKNDATGVELVFLIDESSSVEPRDFQRGLDFIKIIVGEFGVKNTLDKKSKGTRVALLTFGDIATLRFNLNDTRLKDRKTFNTEVDKVKPTGGGTALSSALANVWLLVKPLLRPGAQKALFILSDGQNNIGNSTPASAARTLRDKDTGFEIFSIGIGRDVNNDELRSVASKPHSTHVFLLRNFDELEALNNIVIERAADFSKCGISGNFEAKKNASDKTAREGAWPWLTRIASHRGDICGGALICSNWILTAARCIVGLTPEDIELEIGVHNITGPSNHVQHVMAKRFYMHPAYNATTYASDVALIELDTDYDDTSSIENKWVRSVCLTDDPDNLFEKRNTEMSSSALWVGGWGFSPFPLKPPFLELQSMKLAGVDTGICKTWARKDLGIYITPEMFCAGDRYLSHEACRGDFGGPVVYKRDDDRFVVVGVAIGTSYCNKFSQYGLYQRVSTSSIANWIHDLTDKCNLKKQHRSQIA